MTKVCLHLHDALKISQKVYYDEEGFNIEGCCGGGCCVITRIKFCPFCGEKLEIPKE